MQEGKLNRPLVGYLVVQSALVMVVLAASYLLEWALAQALGWQISRLGLAFWLVLAMQFPVAILFARSETRNLTGGEAWALAGTFVCATVLIEAGLQSGAGHLWSMLSGVGGRLGGDALVLGLCLVVLAGIAVAGVLVMLFRLSVRENLQNTQALRVFRSLGARRPPASMSGVYRRTLASTLMAVVGLALILGGAEARAILGISAPAAIFLGIVCVANKLAANRQDEPLARACLRAAMELMPLTLTCLILGCATLSYAQLSAAPTVLLSSQMMLRLALNAAVLLSVALAVNTLALVVLVALIRRCRRPVAREVASLRPRPAELPVVPADLPPGLSPDPEAILTFRTARELLAERGPVAKTRRPGACIV